MHPIFQLQGYVTQLVVDLATTLNVVVGELLCVR